MPAPVACHWSGVFPAATTQFDEQLGIDFEGTQRVQQALLDDGVHGLVLMGTVGEGNSLTAEEKRRVLKGAVEVAAGKVPVIVGVSELSTTTAATFARDAEKLGADGLMVLPAMVYVPTPRELEFHFRTVAAASGLPIMLYNNPPSYRVSMKGWVSGLTNAFPVESLQLYEALMKGDLERARRIYRWFMPLLHLDAEHDLVQSIKLAEQVMGRGSERVRPPRLTLEGARRAEVMAMIEKARDTRPRG